MTEHERIPTKLELDRFVKSLGYVDSAPSPVVPEPEIRQFTDAEILGLLPAQALIDVDRAREVLTKIQQACAAAYRPQLESLRAENERLKGENKKKEAGFAHELSEWVKLNNSLQAQLAHCEPLIRQRSARQSGSG